MGKNIRVLLVDDHALVRRGFRRILEDDRTITVVGEAGDGIHALQLVSELRPDIVIMDCAMPGGDGFHATREITTSHSTSKVLILSMHSEESWIQKAIEAGAHGYIFKNALELDLIRSIKRVVAGEFLFERQMLDKQRSHKRRIALTQRELQIIELVVHGKSTKEIAHLLRVSVNTVASHRARIARTLGLRSTAELVVYAIRYGLVIIP
jgi:DNA-binding NarL/FixJ family response regulator